MIIKCNFCHKQLYLKDDDGIKETYYCNRNHYSSYYPSDIGSLEYFTVDKASNQIIIYQFIKIDLDLNKYFIVGKKDKNTRLIDWNCNNILMTLPFIEIDLYDSDRKKSVIKKIDKLLRFI